MGYLREMLDSRIGLLTGHGLAADANEVRAGYGECTLCPCPKFEGGMNDEACGNCRHSKDVHRY